MSTSAVEWLQYVAGQLKDRGSNVGSAICLEPVCYIGLISWADIEMPSILWSHLQSWPQSGSFSSTVRQYYWSAQALEEKTRPAKTDLVTNYRERSTATQSGSGNSSTACSEQNSLVINPLMETATSLTSSGWWYRGFTCVLLKLWPETSHEFRGALRFVTGICAGRQMGMPKKLVSCLQLCCLIQSGEVTLSWPWRSMVAWICISAVHTF